MTRRIIALLALFYVVHSNAQPIITEAVIPSIDNQMFYERLFFTSTFYTTPVGANVTWDFTHISLKQERYHQWWADPIFKEGHSNYPSANLFVNGFVRGGLFYERRTDGFYKVGSYQDSVSYLSFEKDPALIIPTPITFGETYQDSFFGIHVTSVDTINLIGSVTIKADAYGTLKLKNGTYHDVLRLYYDDYLAWYDDGQLMQEQFNKEYRWYNNSHKEYLLSHNHIVIKDATFGVVIDEIQGYYLDSLFTNVEEIGQYENEIEFYPIPTDGLINIDLRVINEPLKIDVYGTSGKLLSSISNQSKSIVQVRLADKPGLYLIRISNSKGEFFVRRVLKI